MNTKAGSPLPREPGPPLRWPDIVFALGELAPDAYLVGGCVRDMLLRHTASGLHDLDLATGGNGLTLARRLADALGGAYYPLDPERGVGRAIVKQPEGRLVLDVARFRGEDLLTDLTDRDFTINAMAVRLAEPELLIDPLDGEDDLLRNKALRLCHPQAIAHDPIRALRAVRFGLRFNLRLGKETLAAVRADGTGLIDEHGQLVWPERARDELVKMLAGANPAGAIRLLEKLGLLTLAFRTLQTEHLPTLEHLADLLLVVSPARDDDTAADLTYGLAVMVLDRYRRRLQEHLGVTFADGRPLGALLALSLLVAPGTTEETVHRLRLSNGELGRLAAIKAGIGRFATLGSPPTPRDIHRYFQGIGEGGIDAALLSLAAYLAEHRPTPDPEGWRSLLDEVVSPLLDGFFRRHQQIVKPPPLLTGDDLITELGLQPGPQIGYLLERLSEAQAADEVRTREEALRLAKHWAKHQNQT